MPPIEYSVANRRFIDGLGPMLRRRVYLHLEIICETEGADAPERKHVLQAISRAHLDYESDNAAKPSNVMTESAAAYDRGEWISSEEWLSELQCQVS